jgi:hypothetical protein
MPTVDASTKAQATDALVKVGRVALATQGVLYVVMGLLAVALARRTGNSSASQKGAIASVARQPFGRVLLVVLVVGLIAHALWRLALAIRGEPGSEDKGSVAKRIGNLWRVGVYVSFTVVAVHILTRTPKSGGGNPKQSTAVVLGFPGGRWLVIGAGLAVFGDGVWNAYKGVTRKFADNLDLSKLDQRRRQAVRTVGTVGYLARAGAFALVGWFLVKAGLHHDPNQTEGLDGALRRLAATNYGPTLLLILALGLVLFGAFRMLDAFFRKPSEIAWA